MSEPTSYRDLIEAHVAAAGLAPTEEQIQAADALLLGRIITFSTGITMVDGELASPDKAVAHACGWFPKALTPPAPPAPVAQPEPPPPPAPPSRWTGLTAAALARTATNGATTAKAAHEGEQVEHARRLAAGPNPFRAGGNQTHRAIIRKYLPEIADNLKVQAG
ncbi:hypothetical protein [Methylobacterium sp. 22177]|uniref:hypothetical protein n=1 Tax=Methylobacterium sp. 22177 TaxID=3453885 RepID=UPI003F82D375